jgi:hypothetical protein
MSGAVQTPVSLGAFVYGQCGAYPAMFSGRSWQLTSSVRFPPIMARRSIAKFSARRARTLSNGGTFGLRIANSVPGTSTTWTWLGNSAARSCVILDKMGLNRSGVKSKRPVFTPSMYSSGSPPIVISIRSAYASGWAIPRASKCGLRSRVSDPLVGNPSSSSLSSPLAIR